MASGGLSYIVGSRVDPFNAGWKERAAILGPLYALIALGLVLGLRLATGPTMELVGLIPVSFFAAGKFLPLWAVSGKSHFGPYELGAVIWVLDTFTVLNIVYALEAFYRIGPIKRGLERVQRNAHLVLAAYPRFRRAALVGVVAFVCFPVAGTGAIGGTFIGILLGMNRFVLMAAVSAGGFIGGMAMAFAAVHFRGALIALRELQEGSAARYVLVGIVASSLAAGIWGLGRAYRRALERAQAAEEGRS